MPNITRRGFLSICAGSLFISVLPEQLQASQEKVYWEGIALGAKSNMTLYHKDITYAKKTLIECINEVRALENIFSLFDKTSAISRLNKYGILENPPKELVEVLRFANTISENTKGAFDISVQPLWNIHSSFYIKKTINSKKEFEDKIKKAKTLISWHKIQINDNEIKFKKLYFL